jgi:phosphoribosyl 1,2-cyclic phosphate phosphodiesterase
VSRIPQTTDIRDQLLLLGTGTSMGVPVIGCDCPTCTSDNPRNRRTRTSVVLGLPEGNLLIDTPPDLHAQLLRERLGIVHAVLFTHAHADHLFGFDDLRLFPYYLGRPLPLYCEAIVEDRIRLSFDYAFDPALASIAAGGVPQVEFQRITTEPFEVLGAQVTPIRLGHGRLDILGFRVGDVAYCTDTNRIPAESWPRLAGLQLLILDALRHRSHPTHFNLEESIAAAQRIGAEQTYFTHMSHELEHVATNAALPPGIQLAYDGLRLPLG